jgi:site-specific DNA recombinase
VRVSTPGQEEDGTSLATQEERCRAYAAEHGYVVDEAHVYREVYSGVQLWERPQLTRLREAVRRREVGAVVAYAIDRLARDPVHLGVILSEAEHMGATVAFVTEPLDTSPEGQLICYVRGYAAKVEHEKIKERTIRGRLARLAAGKPLPGYKAPYGYVWADDAKTRLEIDPVTGPIVQRIFQMAAGGGSLRAIVTTLNAAGVPGPLGGRWAWSSLRVILHREVYLGRWVALRRLMVRVNGRRVQVARPVDEHQTLAGVAPALIDEETFRLVQERLRRNKQQAARNNRDPKATLLRGGYARCGYCGVSMTSVHIKGSDAWRYQCTQPSGNMADCSHPNMRAGKLDAAVWEYIEGLLLRPHVLRERWASRAEQDTTADDLAAIALRLRNIEKRQQAAARAVTLLDDEAAAAPLVRELSNLSQERQELLREQAQLERRQADTQADAARLHAFEDWCTRVARNLRGFTYEHKRLALDALGIAVDIYHASHAPQFVIRDRLDAIVSNTSGAGARCLRRAGGGRSRRGRPP